MTRPGVLLIGAAVALGCAAGTSLLWADDKAAPAVEAKHFSHADHTTRGVTIDDCQSCHRVDPEGKILAPAAQGHAPCLDAKCHATEFLAVGTSAKTRTKDAAKFAKASAFCTGCHQTVPWPWKKATTRIVPSFKAAREYHVELDHFAHTTKALAKGTSCRGCHIVDGTSFALVVGTPGHAQCQTCHNAKDLPAFTMAKCGSCHQAPARAQYFQEQLARRGITKRASRPRTRVRACGGEVHSELVAKNPKVPCFKHERIEHRTENGKPDGALLQCAKCHYIVADKRSARTYQSLVDLRIRPIIDNDRDRQHASCGRAGCHVKEVRTATCAESFCHADMSVY